MTAPRFRRSDRGEPNLVMIGIAPFSADFFHFVRRVWTQYAMRHPVRQHGRESGAGRME